MSPTVPVYKLGDAVQFMNTDSAQNMGVANVRGVLTMLLRADGDYRGQEWLFQSDDGKVSIRAFACELRKAPSLNK